jgi:hypothetical protein
MGGEKQRVCAACLEYNLQVQTRDDVFLCLVVRIFMFFLGGGREFIFQYPRLAAHAQNLK